MLVMAQDVWRLGKPRKFRREKETPSLVLLARIRVDDTGGGTLTFSTAYDYLLVENCGHQFLSQVRDLGSKVYTQDRRKLVEKLTRLVVYPRY